MWKEADEPAVCSSVWGAPCEQWPRVVFSEDGQVCWGVVSYDCVTNANKGVGVTAVINSAVG